MPWENILFIKSHSCPGHKESLLNAFHNFFLFRYVGGTFFWLNTTTAYLHLMTVFGFKVTKAVPGKLYRLAYQIWMSHQTRACAANSSNNPRCPKSDVHHCHAERYILSSFYPKQSVMQHFLSPCFCGLHNWGSQTGRPSGWRRKEA